MLVIRIARLRHWGDDYIFTEAAALHSVWEMEKSRRGDELKLLLFI